MWEGESSENENIETVKKILETGFQNFLIFMVVLTVCDHQQCITIISNCKFLTVCDQYHWLIISDCNVQVYIKLLDWLRGD